MSGRDAILGRVRAAVAHRAPHPGPHPVSSTGAMTQAFAEALRAAGGEVRGPVAAGELASALKGWAPHGGRRVAQPSAATLLRDADLEVADPEAAPASFADVAVAVARGAVGVAENGAVAVLEADAPQRALLVLPERLVLLLDAERIVGDLHAGFRALPAGAADAHHLTWIAGPSKTADIEQTLVQGAHGPRAHLVLLHRG